MFGTSHHPVQVRSVRIAFVALAAAVFALGLVGSRPAPAGAQATTARFVSNTFPYDRTVPYDCAGFEPVRFTGLVHVNVSLNVDPTGGEHYRGHLNISGVRGVGLVTGTPYQLAGQWIESENHYAGSGGLVYGVLLRVVIAGPGPNNNAIGYTRLRLTINANDVVTVDSLDMSLVCR